MLRDVFSRLRFLEAKYSKSLDKVDESVDALLRGEEEKSPRGQGWKPSAKYLSLRAVHSIS